MLLVTTGLLHLVWCLLSNYYQFSAYSIFTTIFCESSLPVQSPPVYSSVRLNGRLLVASLLLVELFNPILSHIFSLFSNCCWALDWLAIYFSHSYNNNNYIFGSHSYSHIFLPEHWFEHWHARVSAMHWIYIWSDLWSSWHIISDQILCPLLMT